MALNIFIANYTLYVTEVPASSGVLLGTCVCGDDYGDSYDPNNATGIYMSYSTTVPTIFKLGIGERILGTILFGVGATTGALSFNTIYNINLFKNEADVMLTVYSVSGEIVTSATYTLQANIIGTYFMPIQAHATATTETSGYVENFTVDELNFFDEELALRKLPSGELALRTLPNPEVAMRTLPSSELAVKVRK